MKLQNTCLALFVRIRNPKTWSKVARLEPLLTQPLTPFFYASRVCYFGDCYIYYEILTIPSKIAELTVENRFKTGTFPFPQYQIAPLLTPTIWSPFPHYSASSFRSVIAPISRNLGDNPARYTLGLIGTDGTRNGESRRRSPIGRTKSRARVRREFEKRAMSRTDRGENGSSCKRLRVSGEKVIY